MSVENHTKIANFPWNCVLAQGSQETRMMVLSDGRKLFQIVLAVLIQYRRVTDSQPPSQTCCRSKYHAYCVAQVTRSSADADNRLDAFSGQSRSTNMVPFHM